MEIDVEINREGFDSEKYELRQSLFGTDDVLPLWVADQDLPTPEFIIDALKERLNHPILGYSVMPNDLYQSIIDWQAQYGYSVQTDEILFTHNVANGFHIAVQALTEPGDSVLVQTPVYPPFLGAPGKHQCQLVEVELKLDDSGVYQMDFEALESAMIQHQPKLMLFCHPQNPSGRVWREAELRRLAELALRHGVLIVSDEIHGDLTNAPLNHTPLASLSSEVAENTITLNSPGKTFNLGGLQCGYAIIRNRIHRNAFKEALTAVSLLELNLMAMIAMKSAYSEQGMAYKTELMVFFERQIDRIEAFFADKAPEIKIMRPEASFLIWIDFSALFKDDKALKQWLIRDCRLGLNEGLSFGEAGRGFMRMNIAISSVRMDQALIQLEQGLKKRKDTYVRD